jgi:hypothetical protein
MNEIITSAPNDWEILQLNISDYRVMTNLLKQHQMGILWSQWNKYTSTVAYIINKEAMRKIVTRYIKFRDGIIYDLRNEKILIADVFIYSGLKTYVINKSLFNYFTTDSNIHDSHLRHQNNAREMINECYK